MFQLKNKIAVVTGASRGIGRALTVELAKKGAHIYAIARNQEALKALKKELEKNYQTFVMPVTLDLTDNLKIENFLTNLKKDCKSIDILILNAAMLGSLMPIANIDEKKFHEIFNLNFFSQWKLLKNLTPFLKKSTAGRIVAMSSSVAHKARANWGIYGASKAALEILIRSYAIEMESSNLCINLVNPGGTRTDMRAQAMPKEDPNTLPSAEDVAQSILPLLDPKLAISGKIFDYRIKKFLNFD